MVTPVICRCAGRGLLRQSGGITLCAGKVVEVSRHGVRPPTPGNRQAMQDGTDRAWPQWTTRDGELTGHGYAAAVLKGRYEAEYYRRQGLLERGCPAPGAVYVWASPLQRTRATAQALMDGAFPGCGVAIHAVSDKQDPLFQADKMGLTPLDAEKARAAIQQAMGGSPEQAQQRLSRDIARLQAAVCQPNKPCPAFEQPWRIERKEDGRFSITGLGTLSNMAESIRLAYSENLPAAQVAFGHGGSASAIAPLLPLLTARYDFTNDVPYIARRGGSVLLNQITQALASDRASADARRRRAGCCSSRMTPISPICAPCWASAGSRIGTRAEIFRRPAVWCLSAGAINRAVNAFCAPTFRHSRSIKFVV